MDELYDAIADYLRRHRRARTVLRKHEAAILGSWRERDAVPRCKVCGVLVDDDEGGLYNLADMWAVRECRDHYVPF